MDLSQAVAAGVSSGFGGGRKRARSISRASGARKAARSSVSRNLTWKGRAFPPICRTKLKYVDTAAPASAGGSVEFLIRANSAFDPYYAAGGHQPMGFDQYAGIYDSYRVLSMSYKLTFSSTDNTDSRQVHLVVWANNVATTAASLSDAIEQAGSKYTIVRYPGGEPHIISGKIHNNEVVGQTPTQYKMDNGNRSLCTADPANLSLFHIFAHSGIATFSGSLLYELTYDIEFVDTKATAQS